MKQIFIILILIAGFLRPIKAENPPAFGFVFQPGLTNMHSDGNNIETNSRFGFKAGLKYSFPIGKKTSLDTRFLFSHINANLQVLVTDWNIPLFPENGDEYIGYNFFIRNNAMEYDLSYSFLTIPVTISQKIIAKNNFDLSLRGGLAFSTLLNDNTRTISGILNPFEEKYQRTNFSGIIGFPLHFTIHNNLNLMIEPQFSYMLNDFIRTDQSNYRIYGMGVNVGLVYRFFKPEEEE